MDKTYISESEEKLDLDALLNTEINKTNNEISDVQCEEIEISPDTNDGTDAIYFDKQSSAKGSPLPLRLAGAILCFVFCITSVSVYSGHAIKAVDMLFSNGIQNAANKEIFDEAVEFESSEAEADNFETDNTDSKEQQEDNSNEEGSKNEAGDNDAEKTFYNVSKVDLSASSPLILSNETEYSPEIEKLSSDKKSIIAVSDIYAEYGSDAPCILIIHTHATESYSDGAESYSVNESFRTEDMSKNVVAIGDIMEETFKYAGVNVIHDRTLYDKESYRNSYSKSYEATKKVLDENPSLKYVFDVHRDAIIDSNKTKYRPLFEYEGENTAQMMTVVGTDEGGAEHPSWQRNLSLALQIQNCVFSSFSKSLARNINLRSAAFNQGLSSGSLLLEIGSCGNTLNEAKRCGILTALAISKAIGAPSEPNAKDLFALLITD